jgi:hypothetical protein
LALCISRTVGLGGKPSRNHRVVLWSSVKSVEVDHLIVGGDKRSKRARWVMGS